jgi:hypothetical protein
MALAGKAIAAIWNDITPEGRANFYEWHSREHMPERIGIPGFRRGRRYIGIDAQIEFFTLYEADSTDVLTGPDYKQRLNNPTDWSRRSVVEFRNNLRGICRTIHTAGHAEGGYLFTLRFDVDEQNRTQAESVLSGTILPALLEHSEITGTHLCVCDHELSGTNTDLQRQRKIGVPDWVVMIEGSTAAGTKAAAASLTAQLERLQQPVVKPGAIGELYQLEYSLAKLN